MVCCVFQGQRFHLENRIVVLPTICRLCSVLTRRKVLPLHLFRSSSHPCRCGCPMLYPLHLPKKSVLLSENQRGVQPSPFSRFQLLQERELSMCPEGSVQSSNGCDSGLLLELELKRRNSKYDLAGRQIDRHSIFDLTKFMSYRVHIPQVDRSTDSQTLNDFAQNLIRIWQLFG
ncbi:hypothetical protein AVEN_164060-1 [Araneus ventricosus]|uniref:Uncharacterized protein n=1 Tax=Araneus ventricosus TaxID=182803 RepID=A0A4Y2G086_ARAVE|nr:hypothetical protein AVEN_164060-1 [Araneus ventricosus]